MQQAVGVEGVPDAAVRPHAHVEADLGGAGADHLAVLGRLFGGGAVFAADMLDDVLAFGRDLRVQLERLEGDVRRDALTLELVQGRRQSAQPHHAPGADHVRDEVDLQGLQRGGGVGHGAVPLVIRTIWCC
ncbi:hypothetical protein D3C86_1798020 [compost metagenome]